eukprot:TRINITY_DN4149_c2_g1_i1.p1 TRINITY_DN4149_c2_g1~~TRINITY_DN4149_c2_g1_i1.p1  ORF type:complete len:432 (+),score=101.91 TRINITY_DN4149_c2_g1_i1:55-1350(+)
MAVVLVVGGGGREHALGWKVAQSSQVSKVYFAPGNAGTSAVGENVDIGVKDFDKLKAFCVENKVETVIVGPEDPLCSGIHDDFESDNSTKHIHIVGPKKAGAQLEGSKAFSKLFMQKHNVPTAKYLSVTSENSDAGKQFLSELKPPYVLKADGLAAGKGVLIIDDLEEAKKGLDEMLAGQFGSASANVVIEEYLDGKELSVFVLIDTAGNYKILPTSCDFKRAGDNDTGLNTGGMGAVSPCPFGEGSDFLKLVEDQIVKPTVSGLVSDNLGYTGFLYVGLMNVKGSPFVVEFNCRMGDPETEVVMPRIKSDLYPLLTALRPAKLNEFELTHEQNHATTVMLVSSGYPGSYPKGKVMDIKPIDSKEALIFHAGTKLDEKNVVTSGGRVIAAVGLGKSLKEATALAYSQAETIKFEGAFYRKDIAKKLIEEYC